MADTFKIKDAPMLGYLNKDFELFYICEESLPDFSYHYHDFYKLLIHMQGDVSYHIEGKEYALQSGDTLLISPGEIHKAELKKACCYERIIAYISEEFFKHEEAFNVDLKQCFVLGKQIPCGKVYQVIRLSIPDSPGVKVVLFLKGFRK